jgi:two-component system, NtrC family, sensor kinase
VSGPEQLEPLAELSASIANDVNTPAQYVADNVSFLRRAFDKLFPLLEAQAALSEAARSGAVTEGLLAAVDSARSAARLDYLQRQVPRAIEQSLQGLGQISASMRALKELSRPSAGGPEPTDLHELIEAASTLTKSEWSYVADLRLDFDWSLPPVPILRAELSRLLVRLIMNAARSINASLSPGSTEKGSIVISTKLLGELAELRVSANGAASILHLPLAKP